MTAIEVSAGDRRPLDEMKDKSECDHQRVYVTRDGMWCCADCPEYAWKREWFDSRTATTKGSPPVNDQ